MMDSIAFQGRSKVEGQTLKVNYFLDRIAFSVVFNNVQ